MITNFKFFHGRTEDVYREEYHRYRRWARIFGNESVIRMINLTNIINLQNEQR